MHETPTSAFRAEFGAVAAAYLDRVADCTGSVRPGIEYYQCDDTEAFCGELERVRRIESECDERLATVRHTIGRSMEPNFTPMYFRPGSVLDLFARTDEAPNHVEAFLGGLAATKPSLSATLAADLVRMGDLIVDAVDVLAAAVSDLFAGPDDRRVDAVHEARDTVADLESRCDTVRRKLVSEAFAEQSTADALVVRGLAVTLDRAMDAVEDAAERAVYLDIAAVSADEFADTD
ncbi:DUF47 family protein [Halorientalis halophila]|uniref:DUF47 family protein n=1 Tax=Halorientalis halophila TaxID=3108499 RepID=UPI00300BBB69